MESEEEQRDYVKHLAGEAIGTLASIADAARSAYQHHQPISSDGIAPADIETMIRARDKLDKIGRQLTSDYLALVREPAIARVAVVDEQGGKRTYYICRGAPVGGAGNLASYRAPIGRLASLPVGEELELTSGAVLQVLEKALVYPSETDLGWDSVNSVLEAETFGPVTIESLRKALQSETPLDPLAELLEEEAQSANIVSGLKRSVIEKMSLRDQPILDKYQDEIFRLPLNQTLLILGPPGTGKTTTLIKRLGQKLDLEFLEEDERRAVEAIQDGGALAHDKSWLMFTPTELLKQYLKEAFALEGVPAPDTCIKTWTEYQRILARNTFGLLASTTNRGGFVLKDMPEAFTPEVEEDPSRWAHEFDRWQVEYFLNELQVAAASLARSSEAPVSNLGQSFISILEGGRGRSIAATISALVAHVPQARGLREKAQRATAAIIDDSLREQIGVNKNFLDELAKFLAEVDRAEAAVDEGDDEDSDEEESEIVRNPRSIAKQAYERAMREQARALAGGRTIRKGRRNAKVIEWLAGRRLSDAELRGLAAGLEVQGSAGRFVNPVRRYFDGLPRRYRYFRREQLAGQNKWYRGESVASDHLDPAELDVLLLCSLQNANEFLARSGVESRRDDPVWAVLAPFRDLYRNQILVDEAPDFSPVQLACMAAMCHPRIRSFFACGDFNQRLTTWGARSLDQVKAVLPAVEIRNVQIAYRQSRELNDLATQLISMSGQKSTFSDLPDRVNNAGVAPVLLEKTPDLLQISRWMGQRIREIESFVGKLPSVAVFVPGEAHVEPFAAALSAELSDINTQAVACVGGRSIGHDNDVRVFDVQHIKGLEFEAVFFVGIDALAAEKPRSFERYLYVGATRAATYLGLTSFGVLPEKLDAIRPRFVSQWAGQ